MDNMRLLIIVEDMADVKYFFKSIVNINVSYDELGFDGRNYVGLIFSGKYPDSSEINDLLLSNGVHLERE